MTKSTKPVEKDSARVSSLKWAPHVYRQQLCDDGIAIDPSYYCPTLPVAPHTQPSGRTPDVGDTAPQIWFTHDDPSERKEYTKGGLAASTVPCQHHLPL
jgi:hypothetical protein